MEQNRGNAGTHVDREPGRRKVAHDAAPARLPSAADNGTICFQIRRIGEPGSIALVRCWHAEGCDEYGLRVCSRSSMQGLSGGKG